MDRTLNVEQPTRDGWLPAWAGWEHGTLQVEWCYFGERPLREPFFQDSLVQVMRKPVNQLLRHRTPAEALRSLHAQRPGLPPSGFVFHTSRCGSTLVAQMLAAVRGSVVLSEPAPLDAVLRAEGTGAAVDDLQRTEWLVGMLSALGQPRMPGDRHLFVKFDAWHARWLPLVRRAYPEVPWVFLYRDPREVLASQLRQTGAFVIPGGLPGAIPACGLSVATDTVAQRVARLLEEVGEAALAALPGGRGLLVNYAQLPDAVSGVIADHVGLELGEADRRAMAQVARFDAKTPSLNFERRDEPPVLSEAAQCALKCGAMRVYEALERVRLGRHR